MNFLKINLCVLLCILGGVAFGGCGSDSGSGSPAVKKGQKNPAGQTPKVVELLTDKTRGDKVRESSALPASPGLIDRKNIPVIPPSQPGGKGLTQGEVEALRAKSVQPLDSKSRQVIPPGKSGAKGVTQGEVDALKGMGQPSRRSEVIPPPTPGGQGITEKELNASRTKSGEPGESRNREVIPPQTPGGHGITEREINTLRPAASSLANSPVVPGPEVSRTIGKAPVNPSTSPAAPASPTGKSR